MALSGSLCSSYVTVAIDFVHDIWKIKQSSRLSSVTLPLLAYKGIYVTAPSPFRDTARFGTMF
jgi:hypothetical protein